MLRNVKKRLKRSGFSLVEVLVAIGITTIIAICTAGLLTYFGIYTRKNIDMSCIVWSVSSTLEACKGGVIRNEYDCGGKKVIVGLQGNCSPQQGTCSEVIASYQNFVLKDKVCNF